MNVIQSKVKQMAFDSDDNLLICAPTGSGKTNVALMVVLREVNKFRDSLEKVKIVYLCPLKALA